MAAEQPTVPGIAPILAVLDNGCWRHVFEALHNSAQPNKRTNSIGRLARTCKALQDAVRQWREHAGFTLHAAQGAQVCGRCLSRLQACRRLCLRIADVSDTSLCLSAFLRAADNATALNITEVHVDGGRVDAATALAMGKTLRNVACASLSNNLSSTPEAEGEAMACLAHCWPNLQHLSCDWATATPQPVIDAVAALTNLRSLELSARLDEADSDDELEYDPNAGALQVLTGLTRMELRTDWCFPSDWGWLRHLSDLRELALLGYSEAQGCLDADMAEALSGLPCLERLHVHMFNDESALARSSCWRLPALHTLELETPNELSIHAAAEMSSRCPCLRSANLHVELAAPASHTPEHLAAKLRTLQAFGQHGWLGAGGKLLVDSISASVQELEDALQTVAGPCGGPLLPRLGRVRMYDSVKLAQAEWLVAQMPAVRVVECGYQLLPALSALACLEHVRLRAPAAVGVGEYPDAMEVCRALTRLRVPAGRTVVVSNAAEVLPDGELRGAMACVEVLGLQLDPMHRP